ncbi:MAG: hypothetical protein WC312_07310 [Candidatus Omnitrophota bacterium]|jgi:hypothetical protein
MKNKMKPLYLQIESPPPEQWFNPKVTDTGWDKDLNMDTRRAKMLRAHKWNTLATARALQALANVTRDEEIKEAAQKDAEFFYERHRERGERIRRIIKEHAEKERKLRERPITPPYKAITPREKPITPREKRLD